MNEIEVCEFEDLSNDHCVNCINGLPRWCPKEDAERKELRELVHKSVEANRRKAYEHGYERGRADEINELLTYCKNKVIDCDICPFGTDGKCYIAESDK